MARLYSNENFPRPAVEALRALGHDVLTTQEAGNSGQAIADEAVLTFAHETGRIVITLNRRHFVRLHNEHNAHAGIIVCTFDRDFKGLAERIHEHLQQHPNVASQLIRINRAPSPPRPKGKIR